MAAGPISERNQGKNLNMQLLFHYCFFLILTCMQRESVLVISNMAAIKIDSF